MLSVVTLSTKSKLISYDDLMREIEISSVREVEDLLIRCIYGGLIEGKLDQQLPLPLPLPLPLTLTLTLTRQARPAAQAAQRAQRRRRGLGAGGEGDG